MTDTLPSIVATREGGVDRNFQILIAGEVVHFVATREGGVDRNFESKNAVLPLFESPPARVAWIETTETLAMIEEQQKSPPARVAWIETQDHCAKRRACRVATREGGVDRN